MIRHPRFRQILNHCACVQSIFAKSGWQPYRPGKTFSNKAKRHRWRQGQAKRRAPNIRWSQAMVSSGAWKLVTLSRAGKQQSSLTGSNSHDFILLMGVKPRLRAPGGKVFWSSDPEAEAKVPDIELSNFEHRPAAG